MSDEKQPIFWRGELIGHIEDPKKWPALWRGKWVPQDNDFTQRFLDMLDKGFSQWVEYGIGSPRAMAIVERSPRRDIELRLEIDRDETLHIRP
jgi:hypothetical protein